MKNSPSWSWAKKAGMTRGAIYHHFGSKFGLFRELVHRLLKTMGQKILTWAASGPSGGTDPLESLLCGTRGFLTESQSEAYQKIILTEAPAVFGMDEWQRLDDAHTTSTLVEAFTELGKPEEALVLAQAFSGAMNQLSRWIQADEDLEKAMMVLQKMLSASLR
jgi:AcrR family transcriptional regulator